MLRLALIGVGVVSTALAGYVAKRKLFGKSTEEMPVQLRAYPPGSRTRRRKARSSQFGHALDNGEHDLDPTA